VLLTSENNVIPGSPNSPTHTNNDLHEERLQFLCQVVVSS
jgi:hypothetical protein